MELFAAFVVLCPYLGDLRTSGSVLIPGGTQGFICSTETEWVGCVQGKQLIFCTLKLLNCSQQTLPNLGR